MYLSEAYEYFYNGLLTVYSPGEAAAIAEWVFEVTAGIMPAAIKQQKQMVVEEKIWKQLQLKLEELLKHRPVQYVLGEAWFYKRKWKVNESVLIPRPETEELVEWIIADASSSGLKQQLSLLDIGTGSGCIPVTLKKELPQLAVTAVDIMQDALDTAMANAVIHDAAVDFLRLDFLNKGESDQLPVFDIIVSNPPYIPHGEKDNMEKNVADWEPGAALFVPNDDPLIFYKAIAGFAETNLKPGGKIYLETHAAYAKEVAAVFSNDFSAVELRKDISGNERMVKVIR